jgi:uncharacterized protein YaaN involved in tellurite resistance
MSQNELETLDPNHIQQLDSRARELSEVLVSGDRDGAAFREQLQAVEYFGGEAMRRVTESTGRTDRRRLEANRESLERALGALRSQAEGLDPAARGDLLAPRKLFGIIPIGGNRLPEYFREYRQSQRALNDSLLALYESEDALLMENARIDREKSALREAARQLQQYLHIGQAMDQQLEARLPELDASDPARAAQLRDRFLFPLRQRIQDLQQQWLVANQAWLVLETLRANNRELIQGIERTTRTTVAALRTAVTAAQSLTQQQLILDEMDDTIARADRASRELAGELGEEAQRLQRQGESASRQLERLQRVFGELRGELESLEQGRRDGVARLEDARIGTD